jgi:hypothetical protein
MNAATQTCSPPRANQNQQGQAAACGGRPPFLGASVLALLGVALLVIAGPRHARAGVSGSEASPDTTGMALVEWVYDSWTVPWVQVAGASPMLAPASHATLMVLACASANLERDRLARHLSREECEHRMGAIRADQDTALIFRLDLRTFSFPGSAGLARLDTRTTLTLEDDRGRQWSPIDVRRGPAVPAATGGKLRRIYYHPPWLRGAQHLNPYQYDVGPGRDLTIAEHLVRFARHDSRSGEPVVSSRTRWLRLRLSAPGYAWVSTWTFRQPGDDEPGRD